MQSMGDTDSTAKCVQDRASGPERQEGWAVSCVVASMSPAGLFELRAAAGKIGCRVCVSRTPVKGERDEHAFVRVSSHIRERAREIHRVRGKSVL